MTSESLTNVLLDLPAGVLRQVLECLSARDTVSLICTCKQLRDVASEDVVWAPKFLKWHYRSARWQTDERPWLSKYGARKEMEKEALRHFQKLCFMRTVFQSVRSLRTMGEDVKDLLMHLALEEGWLKAGQRYWACFALRQVASRLSADSMRRLLAPDAQQSPRIEDGAILLAQIHYPMLDMSGIPVFLDKLAEELKSRMERKGCTEGPAALAVLSDLLFGNSHGSGGQDAADGDAAFPDSATVQHASLTKRLSQLTVPDYPYGLGLKGESAEYYRPDNSLLPYVLTARRGIPISLAIVHAAVAQRAGLHVECVGMPMHLVNKMGEPDTPDERFVDVFAGGALLTRREMRDMMHRLIDSFSPVYLQPMTLSELYQRMCMNLVHTYRAKPPPATPDILKCVLELLLALSDSPDLRQMHAKECDRLGDFEGVRNFLEYKSPGSSREGDMARALINSEQELAREHSRVIRRPSDGSVKHFVGQIMTHARYHYKGVIYGWDPMCRASEHWMQHMNVDSLPKGRYQPFYNVLVDSEDIPFQTTYVAQENIQPNAISAGSSCPPVLHPEVDRYFEGRCEGATRYEPNTAVRHRYPDDIFECDSPVCCGQHHQ